ncbi:MAG: phosphate acyltransferase PlsX [Candidatus Binataceae bacterium]
MKIALDAMGGDLAPKAAVEGGVLAARDFGIEVVLVGDREVVAKELAEHDIIGLNVRIEHAAEVVLMDDSPLESILSKPQSSLHIGFHLVKDLKADAFVSAGNSGAMMVAASVILGNLPYVDRPAIGTIVPTTEGQALLIDAGANTEVKPLNLAQFAVMGAVYWRRVQNVSVPRVGILSNGEEASKGTELTRSAAAMLGQMSSYVNYIGYVEGRDINRAKADVIVTDGFTGNVALKTMEGLSSLIRGNLRELLSGSWAGRIAYLLIRKRLAGMIEKLDPHEVGGAPLLGVNGVAIIAHGSSNARAIRNAVRAAANEALVRHVNPEIIEILGRTQTAGTAGKPSGKGIRALFSKMRERLQRHPKDAAAAPGDSSAVSKEPDAEVAHPAGRAATPVISNPTGELKHYEVNHAEPLPAENHVPATHESAAGARPAGASNGTTILSSGPGDTAKPVIDPPKDPANRESH